MRICMNTGGWGIFSKWVTCMWAYNGELMNIQLPVVVLYIFRPSNVL